MGYLINNFHQSQIVNNNPSITIIINKNLLFSSLYDNNILIKFFTNDTFDTMYLENFFKINIKSIRNKCNRSSQIQCKRSCYLTYFKNAFRNLKINTS